MVLVTNDNDEIVGLGAIKRTRKDYAAETAKKSGFEFEDKTSELGYVAVHKHYEGEGIAKAMVRFLLECFQDELFATTYNKRMAKVLERYGFCKRGHTWRNMDNTADISLYIRIF